MLRQRIERRLGGGDDLDIETLEECARAELRLGERGVDVLEDPVGGLGGEPLANAEYLMERVVEPDAGGRAAEQVIARGKGVPDLARIAFDRRAVAARDAELLEAQRLGCRACGRRSDRGVMNSAAAFVNGSLSANHCGSVCPCGLTIGRSFTVA